MKIFAKILVSTILTAMSATALAAKPCLSGLTFRLQGQTDIAIQQVTESVYLNHGSLQVTLNGHAAEGFWYHNEQNSNLIDFAVMVNGAPNDQENERIVVSFDPANSQIKRAYDLKIFLNTRDPDLSFDESIQELSSLHVFSAGRCN